MNNIKLNDHTSHIRKNRTFLQIYSLLMDKTSLKLQLEHKHDYTFLLEAF